MSKHICPFCGKEHDKESVPEPMSSPCPECWVNRDDALALMSKEDWATLLEILIRIDETLIPMKMQDGVLGMVDIDSIYKDLSRQVFAPSGVTIATILGEKEKSNEG